MYTRRVFKAKDMALWTRFETLLFLGMGLFWTTLYHFFNLEIVKIPWTPLALIGTAVAFVIGFQNNAAYGRIWEARKIWGGIVNTSRTFGMFVQDMLSSEFAEIKPSDQEIKNEARALTYRHIAWMTALRHAMRAPRPWETIGKERANKEWTDMIRPPESLTSLEEDLQAYLSREDMDYVLSKNNKQTALLYLQSHHLRKLKDQGIVWEFSFLELENVLKELFTLQGQSERIKNFPYPRHFATLNHYFMWLFVLLLPFAMIPQFAEIGSEISETFPLLGKFFIWLSVPFYAIVSWIFHTMERIGRTGENPFEGLANDVPISTIARGIEIDLRQNLGESDEEIPAQFPVVYDTQM
ncbi:MAG: bestrophin family ion channel [Bacteroidia bacterium]